MPIRDATSDEVPPAIPAMTAPPPAASAALPLAPRAGGDWWEVFVVLCVAYAPSVYANYVFLARKAWLDADYQLDLAWDYAGQLVFAPSDCIVVLYLLWRNREPWSTLGLVPFRWIRDPLAALGCFVALVAAQIVGHIFMFAERSGVGPLFLQASPANWYTSPITSPGGLILWVVSTGIAAFAEELLYRGYLIIRLGPLLQSSWMGVFFAAVVFATVHVYQGFEGVLQAWIMGLVLGGLFLWLRRLGPLALAHTAYNLWATWP